MDVQWLCLWSINRHLGHSSRQHQSFLVEEESLTQERSQIWCLLWKGCRYVPDPLYPQHPWQPEGRLSSLPFLLSPILAVGVGAHIHMVRPDPTLPHWGGTGGIWLHELPFFTQKGSNSSHDPRQSSCLFRGQQRRHFHSSGTGSVLFTVLLRSWVWANWSCVLKWKLEFF